MQTFLPVPDFAETAEVLDRQRLGKQRVEAYQILEALAGIETRWKNHPAVRMWKGSELSLVRYGIAICQEWRKRGYVDNMEERFAAFAHDALLHGVFMPGRNDRTPWWMGFDPFHLSHRSQLVRKDPDHYRKYWPDVPDNLDYVWLPGYEEDE